MKVYKPKRLTFANISTNKILIWRPSIFYNYKFSYIYMHIYLYIFFFLNQKDLKKSC